MHRRGVLSAIAIGSALAGCTDTGPGNGTPDEEEPVADERAEITDHGLRRKDAGTDEETVSIAGTVRIAEDGLQHVELRGRFFDAEDDPLDTTFERLTDLGVGTQPFEVQYPEIGPPAAAAERYTIDITTIV